MTVRIIVGDALEKLRELPERSARCCVTSPPYWNLRDYGIAGQIGLESTPELYIHGMVEVFREVRRVLTDDGTLWLNIGDSYANDGKWGGETSGKQSYLDDSSRTRPGRERRLTGLKPKDLVGIPWMLAFALRADGWYLRSEIIWHKPNPMPESITDRPTKAHEQIFLLTKSARYFYDAEAIEEECSRNTHARMSAKVPAGWDTSTGEGGHGSVHREGRSEVKAAGNKERVIDRERGHLGGSIPWKPTPKTAKNLDASSGVSNNVSHAKAIAALVPYRNARSVWTITAEPFKGAHFATFPTEIPRRCILAGSQVGGTRCDCETIIASPLGTGESEDPTMLSGRAGMDRERRADEGTAPITRREQRHHARELRESEHRVTMEDEAGATAFAHYLRTDLAGARPVEPMLRERWTRLGWITQAPPCSCPVMPADTVLDPFGGAGTTGLVADRLGRNAVLLELNPKYAAIAEQRIHSDAPLFSDVGLE